MTTLKPRPEDESSTDSAADRTRGYAQPPEQPQAPPPAPYQPAPYRRYPSRFMIGISAFLIAMMLGVVAFLGFSARGILDAIPTPADIAAVFEPEPFTDIGPVVVSSVQDLGSLTTIEVVEHTVVEQGTDQGWLAWARGDSLRMIVVARIGAGVDISSVTASDFSVTEDGIVTVDLPPADIQYLAVDNEATEVLDRDRGLFTKGDPQLEGEARRVAETVLVDGAIADGVLDQAEDNARVVLTKFLTSLGYKDVTVNFSG